MGSRLDWKWVGLGVLIMLALNFASGLILAVVLGSQVQAVGDAKVVSLSGGQIALAGILNLLAFVIGGFIVGVKSAGRTIVEPGISALVAIVIALVFSRNLSAVNVLIGGVVPFLAGVFGGWLGERRHVIG